MDEVKLIGPKKLAEILSVPISWIYQRTRLGPKVFPHIRVGKYVRFDIRKVYEFLSKEITDEKKTRMKRRSSMY